MGLLPKDMDPMGVPLFLLDLETWRDGPWNSAQDFTKEHRPHFLLWSEFVFSEVAGLLIDFPMTAC
jgi:hypothetical protein